MSGCFRGVFFLLGVFLVAVFLGAAFLVAIYPGLSVVMGGNASIPPPKIGSKHLICMKKLAMNQISVKSTEVRAFY